MRVALMDGAPTPVQDLVGSRRESFETWSTFQVGQRISPLKQNGFLVNNEWKAKAAEQKIYEMQQYTLC